MRIVFLDRATIGPSVTIRRPAFDHDWIDHDNTRPSELASRLAGAAIAVTNKVALGRATLAKLPDLRMIAIAATGHDVVDVAAAREAGIVVSNVRDYGHRSVAEHTFALILALRRRLPLYRDLVADGHWQRSGQFCFFTAPIFDLAGAQLGLIGCGAIGRTVAQLGLAFGMRVAFLDSHIRELPPGADAVSLDALLAESDVVSCHCPLTDETRGLFDARAFSRMKPTALLINTARGGLIDEQALAAAIRSGEIAGAGLDVQTREPPAPDGPLMALAGDPRLVLTPHVAWASLAAMQALADQLIGNIEAFAAGEPRNLL